MEIDRKIIKAVSADMRRKMLKSLDARKKMPSELSRETGLSPSTVVGHLKHLEGAGLIRRVETGHKWVYYELTEKGASITRPKIPVHFSLGIVIGAAIASLGAIRIIVSRTSVSADRVIEEAASLTSMEKGGIASAGSAVNAFPIDLGGIAILSAGLLIITLSIYAIRKRSRII